MFRIGEVVSYGTLGICTIEDIRMEEVSRGGMKKQEYYILRPASAPTCTTYVPTGNSSLTSKIRRVLTGEEIDRMICEVRGKRMDWIADTRQRSETYQRVVSGGISAELLQLIACLYEEKKERSTNKKKFCATDEKLLTAAERLVSEEFSYALQIPEKQVAAYIAQKITQEA